jgi:S-phase kinase-associated protein 1
MSTTIKLSSAENKEFEVEKDVIIRSVLIKNMLEDVGDSEAAIPLPNVSGDILAKVIEYLKYHKDDPPEIEEEDEIDDNKPKPSDDIEPWDYDFCKVELDTLYHLILAANYLDIKPLLQLTCKTVANMIKGKKVEEIRKIFNIENDFTPEEEEQMRKENQWCEDR